MTATIFWIKIYRLALFFIFLSMSLLLTWSGWDLYYSQTPGGGCFGFTFALLLRCCHVNPYTATGHNTIIT